MCDGSAVFCRHRSNRPANARDDPGVAACANLVGEHDPLPIGCKRGSRNPIPVTLEERELTQVAAVGPNGEEVRGTWRRASKGEKVVGVEGDEVPGRAPIRMEAESAIRRQWSHFAIAPLHDLDPATRLGSV